MALALEKIEVSLATPLKSIDIDSLETEFTQFLNQGIMLVHKLKEAPKPAEVAEMICADIKKFTKKFPLMKVLCTRGMSERHFDNISAVLGQDPGYFTLTTETTIKHAQRFALKPHLAELELISLAAAKEHSNLKVLENMKLSWETISFELKDSENTDTPLLVSSSFDNILFLLDEHIFVIQTMKASLYAEVFLETILVWDGWLHLARQAIEHLTTVQSV